MLQDPRTLRASTDVPKKHAKSTHYINVGATTHNPPLASHTIYIDDPSSPCATPSRRTTSLPAGHAAFALSPESTPPSLARRLSTPLAALRSTLSGNRTAQGRLQSNKSPQPGARFLSIPRATQVAMEMRWQWQVHNSLSTTSTRSWQNWSQKNMLNARPTPLHLLYNSSRKRSMDILIQSCNGMSDCLVKFCPGGLMYPWTDVYPNPPHTIHQDV